MHRCKLGITRAHSRVTWECGMMVMLRRLSGSSKHKWTANMCKMHGLVLLLVGLCALPLGQALYQDQAGTYDWYKSYIGHVQGGAFQKNKPRVFVTTEQGTVSSLNLRDGSIAWRHKLEDGEVPNASLFLDSQGLFVTLSGSMLRAWEHADGSLAWQVPVGATAEKPALTYVSGPNPVVAVVAGGQIQVR